MVGRLVLGSRGCLTAVGVVAVLVYANTLLGDFTFDDNFAVITNHDVTDAAIPIKDLFKHDFWGQDITSSQSHKSYRPLTVLAFRLTHRAWCLLTAAVPGINQLLAHLPASQLVQDDSRAARPPGLHPFPFHILCVVMHAMASMLVLGLCQHLFAVLEDSTTLTDSSSIQQGTSAQQCAVPSKGLLQQLLMWQQQPQWWRTPGSFKYRAQALLAGLMFALHPVHTEAVAGIVGCAELLCVALACPALLCYFMAVDQRYAAAQQLQGQQPTAGTTDARSDSSREASKQQVSGRSSRQTKGAAQSAGMGAAEQGSLSTADAVQHWLLVLAAAALAFCAALTKEIGTAVTGTMLLYDLLLAPHIRQPGMVAGSTGRQGAGQQQQSAAARRQLLRMVLVCATAVVYVKMRQWVAVEQLVNIFRKVENPIPFADSRLTRTLSTGYLHARYFGLLILPLHLSADWSFSCIPLVETWGDVRNLATLTLYCYFLYTALSAQPFSLLRQLWGAARLAAGLAPTQPPRKQPHTASGAHAANGKATTVEPATATSAYSNGSAAQVLVVSPEAARGAVRTRWRLMVLVGLVIAPFFPASNVLFYVGTFIGERLLYSPSIGFCLLAAELLGAALPDDPGAQQEEQQQQGQQQADVAGAVQAQSGGAANKQQQGACRQADSLKQQPPGCSSTLPARSWCMLLLCALLLGGYACRTVLRNQDWWDEERLFRAALNVCPNSAKVQQNNGVLQRRFRRFEVALEHFKRAQAIESSYCEPTYWIGLTTFNMGDPKGGLATMKASLSCRYTAAEALQALNKVFLLMMEAANKVDPGPMVEWASVLASPHVLRLADACSTAEDAALGAAMAGKGVDYVSKAVGVCLQGIHEWEHGDTQAETLAALTKKQSSINATLLADCVNMRLIVYQKVAGSTISSQPVKRAVYKYLAQVDERYPACRTLEGGGPMPVAGDDPPPAASMPSTHQKLLHRVQGADPEDPWLQYEWGVTLLALGPSSNLKEAGTHLEVSAAIFAKAAQDMLAQQQGSSQSSQPGGSKALTELDGKTSLIPLTALHAATRPLTAFHEAAAGSTDSGVVAQLCEMLQRLCHLHLQAVMLLQQQRQPGTGGGSDEANGRALQGATEAARQCMAAISKRPACKAHAANLRKMVRIK